MTVDLETYLRQDQACCLAFMKLIANIGRWMARSDYGMELFQEQTDWIEHELTLGFERYPVLQEVGVKTWVNGAFTFLLTAILLSGLFGQKGLLVCLCGDGYFLQWGCRQISCRMDDPW